MEGTKGNFIERFKKPSAQSLLLFPSKEVNFQIHIEPCYAHLTAKAYQIEI